MSTPRVMEVRDGRVAVVVRNRHDVTVLLGWAAGFARVCRGQLDVLWVRDKAGVAERSELAFSSNRDEAAGDGEDREFLRAVSDAAAELSAADQFQIRITKFVGSHPIPLVLANLTETNVRLLVIPMRDRPKGERGQGLELDLFQRSTSETLLLRPGKQPSFKNILVPTGGGPHADVALKWAVDVAGAHDGLVRGLYVEPQVDEVAPLVGRKILDRIVSRVGVSERIRPEVVISNNVLQGINSALKESTSLVILGSAERWKIRRILFGSIGEALAESQPEAAIGLMRGAHPLVSRLRGYCERKLQAWVPQLTRELRVKLVERVQSSSQWDFDFMALISLSTLIAALGLVRNSGAVVIGAMLVAPLMTPLLGAGLALVHGNGVLFTNALRTVLGGFVLAFLIGIGVGLAVPELLATDEMLARGSPNALDLIVALVSGVAAAYASGRPHLVSALPGVAIAAALVPPVASSGLAVSLGHWQLAGGALLLFFTNIVAIILGCSWSLWLIGIRGTHDHGGYERWSWPAALVLLSLAAGLAIYESLPPPRVPAELRQELSQIVHQHVDDARILRIGLTRTNGTNTLDIHIEAPKPPTDSCLTEIRQRARQFYGESTPMQLKTELVAR